ncbi:DNA-directed RNA polymerase, beta subunit [Bifidobacterium actinocoloniiforme DSM 22766]|uniref:DNA-directed RNA polymerase subunit beta n=2 Tax=Bifidobacterium actinocoloniiforme TaxID=638619 RepID=A0A086YZG1_9BIFI|nr:DNA-directed RNA polymerase subunit beta [Bifidobacterium actinocoloniiforme]AKV54995.1 DNA-directed RNA polymerase subunit beta [Bifidobacterium actinocoloniiforme DSM 22766]KFI39661.1 DNA-directed RNA polymerase, beta subunit [Bifidobacterium actinocoloniiforme DSM 22766]
MKVQARADAEAIKLHKASDRVNFGSIKEPIDVPYLLGVQTDSFDWLIGNERWKRRVEEDEAAGTHVVPHVSGLDEVFQEISPIENFAQTMSLAFSDPYFEEPRHTVQECKEKDYTYSAPLYVNAEFENGDTGEIKSQTVFMGDFPLQTPHGTFIIGGTERVIVTQLVRSPGVYFDRTPDRTSDKEVFGAKIIPSRGAWLEFEIDKRDVLGVRVDRKRKQSAIVFLMAIGMSKAEIRKAFKGYPLVLDALEKEPIETQDEALTDLYRKIRPADTASPEAGKNLLESFYFNTKRYDLARVGRYKINRKLGMESDYNDRALHPEDIVATIKYLETLHDGGQTFPGKRDGEDVELRVDVDDIDHFGNRRVRQVGELIQNQLRTGLSRMERVVRERMTTQDAEAITPQSLINIRPLNATIKEFFGTSQLSQFMDQNNPLSGVTNKRRLSALGPGGLSRDRASMEVRDVHPSHYGRMCPIESPEGPNIGLIGSLATFARVNPFGFIETPYRKVVDGKVTDDVVYMTADQESEHTIAQANQELTEDGHFVEDQALVRNAEAEATDVPVSEVDLMDVSPRQMVSVGASLIPFLEHDEGHRALMGTNMQRQAVPLVKSERPLVGTGSEWRSAVDSGDVVLADKPGAVTYVSADMIRVMNDDGTQSSYRLAKFQRSNQTNCYNQVPLIKDGERVEAGTVLADGPATQKGEMALGKNVLVAFMPWNGYNYEDAVIISQRLVRDDTLSSIHIEEYEIDARETKLGAEEITRDLPNVGEDAVSNLDERGIIRIGAEVEAGDILVGKVTPKGETELTPEERLLRAIFGEKSREVRDTSLRVPHGETGTVIQIKEITREEAEEDGDELPNGVNRMIRVYVAQHRKITQGDKLSGRHGNKGVISRILPEEDMPFLPDGTPVDIMLNPLGVPSRMNLGQVLELHLGWIAHAGWDISLDPNPDAEWKKFVPAGAEKGDPGTPVATPVFDGVRPETIMGLLKTTLPDRDGEKLVGENGKAVLYDGRTGEPFPEPISVGYMYMLKLHHLVDDKIHARSTGPYSMITQQPLGGKAQFGGQRFGEMEVWALEAYGAAYTLHEMMTTKSDDVDGRVRAYGAIVRGENLPPAGIPESFKVLLKEMQSLALNVEVLNAEGNAIEMKDEDDDPGEGSELGFNIGARPDAAAKADQSAPEPEFR